MDGGVAQALQPGLWHDQQERWDTGWRASSSVRMPKKMRTSNIQHSTSNAQRRTKMRKRVRRDLCKRGTAGAPNTVRLAHDVVTDGSGQDARATGGAGFVPAASSFIPAAALTKLTVLGGNPLGTQHDQQERWYTGWRASSSVRMPKKMRTSNIQRRTPNAEPKCASDCDETSARGARAARPILSG